MLFPMMVGAQNTGLISVEGYSSAGLFGNELDAALTVDETGNKPAFSELTGNYLFAGLTNLNQMTASDIFVASANNPLWAGYYSMGEMPWSLFAAMYIDGILISENEYGGSTITNTNFTIGTETFTYVSRQVERTNTKNRLFDRLQKEVQFLISLGEINTGVYLALDLNDTSAQINNYNTVDTRYYDSTGGTADPVQELNYATTETRTDYNASTKISLGVPLFLRTGDLAHTVNLLTALTLGDMSTTASYSMDNNPNDTGVALATYTEADDTINTTSDLQVDASYNLAMPALFGENPNNEFSIIGKVGIGIQGHSIKDIITTQQKTFAGGGAAPTLGTRNDDSIEITYSGGFDFDILAGVGHSFYYDFEPGIRFGFNPNIALSFDQNNPTLVSQWQYINRTDGGNDGTLNTAADTVVTTTRTYKNATAVDTATGVVTGDAISISTITLVTSLPMSITFQPKDWPVALILGSTPTCSLEASFRSDSDGVWSQTRHTENGDGSGATDATREADTAGTETIMYSSNNLYALNVIGLSMNLGENVALDISLDFSSTAVNLLQFGELSVQTIVKLPN